MSEGVERWADMCEAVRNQAATGAGQCFAMVGLSPRAMPMSLRSCGLRKIRQSEYFDCLTESVQSL